MRLARPRAAEGDIFSPAAADEFRRRIRRAFAESGYSAAALVEDLQAGEDPALAPAVNETFSWALPNAMPPFMLQALAELPDELQYRFVARDLVLIDIHANLVVDILPDVLPAATRVRDGSRSSCWGTSVIVASVRGSNRVRCDLLR